MTNTKATPSDFEAEARGILVRYGVKVIERGAGTPMNEEIAVAVSALTHLHQQETMKEEKKLLDEIYEVAPDKQFGRWKPADVADFFNDLGIISRNLDKQRTNLSNSKDEG